MNYHEISPNLRLRSFVKCYYVYESASALAFDDTVFPSGCMEMIFNLGSGQWLSATENGFKTNPSVELWGQIIQPLPVRSIGNNVMLGIRFLPHGAACFLREKIDRFNDQVLDGRDAEVDGVAVLYDRLREMNGWTARIGLLEEFLLHHLSRAEDRLDKAAVVNDIMGELGAVDFFDNISNVAFRYGFSSRYLQKLFLRYTGLTPKLYNKIHRFQRSLRLVSKKDLSLTSIAYDCGYFDQSHFIREFKSFTGHTPSGYAADRSPITSAVAQA
jgi:AraC-like DNA-binding protein